MSLSPAKRPEYPYDPLDANNALYGIIHKKASGAQLKSTAGSHDAPGKCPTSPHAQSYSKAVLLLTPTVMADAALGVQQDVQAGGVLGTGGVHSRQCGSCRPGVT